MRIEPFTVGDFVHVYNRGNRKAEIVRDEKDKQHFLQMLRYFNTEHSIPHTFANLKEHLGPHFDAALHWPDNWPKQKPIVKILAFALADNHYHLLLKEICEGGITKFMRKLGTGMTNYFNKKHEETGRLFQGAYKGRTIHKTAYLKYLSVYIQVKHPFEAMPGGVAAAMKNFDKAYEQAANYPYSSLGDYAGKRTSPIIDKDILGEIFPTPASYKKFAKEAMEFIEVRLGDLTIE